MGYKNWIITWKSRYVADTGRLLPEICAHGSIFQGTIRAKTKPLSWNPLVMGFSSWVLQLSRIFKKLKGEKAKWKVPIKWWGNLYQMPFCNLSLCTKECPGITHALSRGRLTQITLEFKGILGYGLSLSPQTDAFHRIMIDPYPKISLRVPPQAESQSFWLCLKYMEMVGTLLTCL